MRIGKRNTEDEKREQFYITKSLGYKLIVFLVMFASLLVGVCSCAGAVILDDLGVYVRSYEEMVKELTYEEARVIAGEAMECLEAGDTEAIMEKLELSSVGLAVLPARFSERRENDSYIWSSYDRKAYRYGELTGVYWDIYFRDRPLKAFYQKQGYEINQAGNVSGTDFYQRDTYIVRVFYNFDAVDAEDDFSRSFYYIAQMYHYRYAVLAVIAVSAVTGLISMILLLCAVGHRNGREKVSPFITNRLPLDLFTAGLGIGGIAILCFAYDFAQVYDLPVDVIIYASGALVTGLLMLLWLFDFAVRVKCGGWWKNTLCYMLLKVLWRILKKGSAHVLYLAECIPLVPVVFFGYILVSIVEFVLMLGYGREIQIVLWCFLKAGIFVLVLWAAIGCSRLLQAGKALAEGDENYRVDTGRLHGKLKEMGSCLNHIGVGITRAVEARMKSERMKTELITNVSHDIKTPLTSIINYADLLAQAGRDAAQQPQSVEQGPERIVLDRAVFEEYTEVLLRQSTRLRKLLENLVEVSKANTGNLEVNMAPCELGVMLTQTVGEYQQRMEEKGLKILVNQPSEAVYIQADGRHLWRVFDNLLGNICKYAQDNSRVYLNMETEADQVRVIFRNMSKYVLDISPDELGERFVRGDKSRHLEGNGLGLAIAGSLVELQGGRMQIVTDGDLFKVILEFPKVQGTDKGES